MISSVLKSWLRNREIMVCYTSFMLSMLNDLAFDLHRWRLRMRVMAEVVLAASPSTLPPEASVNNTKKHP